MTTAVDTVAAGHRTLAVEGCDGAGKTTLAEHLAQAHGFQVVHSGPTPAGHDLCARYRSILSGPGKIVLDRCFVSELVYGPLFRGGCRLSRTDTIELCQRVAQRDGALVLATASTRTIRDRLRNRGEPMPERTIEAIQRAYDDVLADLEGYVTVLRYPTDPTPRPRPP